MGPVVMLSHSSSPGYTAQRYAKSHCFKADECQQCSHQCLASQRSPLESFYHGWWSGGCLYRLVVGLCVVLTLVLYGRMSPRGTSSFTGLGGSPRKKPSVCPQADSQDCMNTHEHLQCRGKATLTYRDWNSGRHFRSRQIEMSLGACWKVPHIHLVSLLSSYCVPRN